MVGAVTGFVRRALIMLALALAGLTGSAMPAAAQDRPALGDGAPIVTGQTHRIASRVLGEMRVVNVWTPPGYAQGSRRYPILYLLDGGLAQDFHHVAGLAHLASISWLAQEMIVVGVETVDRRKELAFPIERDAALRAQYPTAGASADFRRFLIEEVKPAVEAHYRSSGEDALIGESLAGLFVIETLLRTPAAFDTYIAMDPSTWWDGGRLTDDAAALLARQPAGQRRLWLSIGRETSEQPAHNDRLLAALRAVPAASLTLRYEPRPALTHATIYHPTAWEALQALYPRPE